MKKQNLEPVERPDRIFSYFKSQWKVVLGITLTGVLFNASMSAGPILQGRLIDALASGSPLRDLLLQIGLFVGVIAAIQLARFGKRRLVRVFANRTAGAMRRMIYQTILDRDVAALSGESAGDLMTRSVGDVDLSVEGMRKVTTEIFDTGILMLSYLTSLLVYDWKITAAACVFVPAAMWIAQRLKGPIAKFVGQARAQNSLVAERTCANIENIVLTRVSGMEEAVRRDYFRELDSLAEKSTKADIAENSMQPAYTVIASLGVAAVLYFGGQNAIEGVWTVGTFSAYVAIYAALTVKAGKAAKLFNSFQKAAVSWRRIKPYLAQYRRESPETRPSRGEGAALVVKNLSFRYPDAQEPVLRRVSFSAQAGEIIGVTGPVASGKTSLGKALQGMFPYEGSVLLNGRQLCEYRPEELAGQVSYLGHQPLLFSDTIYNNITLGDGGDVAEVLHDAGFDEDLRSMPEGVHTMVGSGGIRLSGGQQSRVALARALYRRTPLIILDDPFSAVDIKTESILLENLRRRCKDSVILLISHRLALFPQTDRILVLHGDRNGSCEYGTHASLLTSSPLYASVYHLQTGGGGHDA